MSPCWRFVVCLAVVSLAPAVRADPEVHVVRPAGGAPGERHPLLVYLHGLGGSGAEALANPELRALAARGGMYLVAPDGNLDHQRRRFWNAGGACCNLDGKAVNDVARLEALIFHWSQQPDIDPTRVYLVGFSNGGFMAHRLACYMDDKLAAVVSLSGAGRAPEEACSPGSPLSVLEVHGDADPIVRYGGGRVFDDKDLDPHPSAPDTIRRWSENLGCLPGTKPRVSTADLDPRLPGSETTITSYADCPLGTAELWTVHGGVHQVMTPALLARVGEFLAAHPKVPRAPKKKQRKKR